MDTGATGSRGGVGTLRRQGHKRGRAVMAKCPVCKEELTCDEVDIGVGTMIGNCRCDSCGWSEAQAMDTLLSAMRGRSASCATVLMRSS